MSDDPHDFEDELNRIIDGIEAGPWTWEPSPHETFLHDAIQAGDPCPVCGGGELVPDDDLADPDAEGSWGAVCRQCLTQIGVGPVPPRTYVTTAHCRDEEALAKWLLTKGTRSKP